MRINHRLSVIRGIWKYFSTSLSKSKNRSAFKIRNIEEKKINSNWFRNDKKLFLRATSIDSLKKAWNKIKSQFVILLSNMNYIVFTNKITEDWFVGTNKKLIENSLKYPTQKKVKFKKLNGSKIFILINPKIKIIEKALLNALEPLFEGYFHWDFISKKTYYFYRLTSLDKSYYKKTKHLNKILYQKKKYN